jgi:hypothetical protein
MRVDSNLPDYDMPTQPGLGFVDGFRFGCGFSVAAAAAVLLAILAFAVLLLIMSLAGVSILDNLLGAQPVFRLLWPT